MPIANYAVSVPAASAAWGLYAPVISALIASLLAIGGIILNNHFARRHKKDEQAHSIKKEIFLDFAEYVSSSMALLQAVASPNSDLRELLSNYRAKAGIIGKMYLVAEPSLLLVARELVTELEVLGSEMVSMRQAVDKMNLKVDGLKALRLETLKALDNLNEHQLSFIRAGIIPVESVQSALEWERDINTKHLKDLDEARFKAEVEVYHATLNLFEIGVFASQKVEEKTLSVLALLKSQLGIAHDSLNYDAKVREQNETRMESARKLIELQKGATPMP
jgi:hypothetical protein